MDNVETLLPVLESYVSAFRDTTLTDLQKSCLFTKLYDFKELKSFCRGKVVAVDVNRLCQGFGSIKKQLSLPSERFEQNTRTRLAEVIRVCKKIDAMVCY